LLGNEHDDDGIATYGARVTTGAAASAGDLPVSRALPTPILARFQRDRAPRGGRRAPANRTRRRRRRRRTSGYSSR